MVPGGGLEVGAVGGELPFHLGDQLAHGEGEPTVGFRGARQIGGDEQKPRDPGQIVVRPVRLAPFRIVHDVAPVRLHRGGEFAHEGGIEAGAVAPEQVQRQQQVGGADRHLHGRVPVDAEPGRIGGEKIEDLVAELRRIRLRRLEAGLLRPCPDVGPGQLDQVLETGQFPGRLDVDAGLVAEADGSVPAARRPAVAGLEVDLPVDGPVVRVRQAPNGAGPGAVARRYRRGRRRPAVLRRGRRRPAVLRRGRWRDGRIAVPLETTAPHPVLDPHPARAEQVEAVVQVLPGDGGDGFPLGGEHRRRHLRRVAAERPRLAVLRRLVGGAEVRPRLASVRTQQPPSEPPAVDGGGTGRQGARVPEQMTQAHGQRSRKEPRGPGQGRSFPVTTGRVPFPCSPRPWSAAAARAQPRLAFRNSTVRPLARSAVALS